MTYAILVRCLDQGDWDYALTVGKVYRLVHEPKVEDHGWWRIIDNEGEDYLYPGRLFERLGFPNP